MIHELVKLGCSILHLTATIIMLITAIDMLIKGKKYEHYFDDKSNK